MWTRDDNGKNINWHDAKAYAESLKLGGYTDWRLPTIEELEQLYDPNSEGRFKIKEPFQLTRSWWILGMYVWSSTMEGSDSARVFSFYLGSRGDFHLVNWHPLRALCVRRSRE